MVNIGDLCDLDLDRNSTYYLTFYSTVISVVSMFLFVIFSFSLLLNATCFTKHRMENENGLAVITRKLDHHRSIVQALIDEFRHNHDSAPAIAGILERKLNMLEDMILRIPPQNVALIKQWHNNVVQLWQKFCLDLNVVTANDDNRFRSPSPSTSSSLNRIAKSKSDQHAANLDDSAELSANKPNHRGANKRLADASTNTMITTEWDNEPMLEFGARQSISNPLSIDCISSPLPTHDYWSISGDDGDGSFTFGFWSPVDSYTTDRLIHDRRRHSLSTTSVLRENVITPFVAGNEDENDIFINDDNADDRGNSDNSIDDGSAEIRQNLTHTFNGIAKIVDPHDADQLERLMNAVAIACHQLKPFQFGFDSLHTEIYQLAASKIPDDMAAQFGQRTSGNNFYKNLFSLKMFLCDRIAAIYHRNAKSEKKLPQPPGNANKSTHTSNVKNDFRQSPNSRSDELAIYCTFCRVNGNHGHDDCPKLKSRVCFRCFKTGHKAKFCVNQPANSTGQKSSPTKNVITCYRCRKIGHLARHCPSR